VTSDQIRKAVQGFNPTLSLDEAWMPPASWYTQPAMYELEQNTVLGSNWLVAARMDQLDQPRKYVCGEIASERYVIVRGDDDKLRAFHNVCRHHAAAVAEGEGSTKRFMCPYHGWTYGLDGKLINAPELGDARDFDPDCFGLVPMAVEAWGPLVFISLAEQPRSLANDLGQLKGVLDETDFKSLRFVQRQTYTLDCNWKVYVDNYLDGGYHVAYLHRGLASQLDLGSYTTELFERFSIQSGGGKPPSKQQTATPGIDFAERVGDRVVYAWVYPSLMINRYGNIMDVNWVIPMSHDRTKVIFDYYFLDTEGRDAEDFIKRSIIASDVVQQEDTGICEAVQVGLSSSSYDRGRYSPVREMGEYHFHQLLAADLSTALF